MRLLYAIDIRDEELWNLDQVALWARRLGARVDMIYVNPFGEYAPYSLDPALSRALKLGLEKARNADRAAVSKAMALLPEDVRGEVRLGAGEAAEAIGEASVEYDATLISTRANTGLKRLWMGSVAERVLRQLKNPAIVLHGRHEESPA